MKGFISVFVLLTVFVVEASYYGNSEINTYDPTTGYYYKAIGALDQGKGGLLSSSKSTRKMTNIAIYQPSTDSHKLLFKKDIERSISFVFFESAFNDNSIQFNGTETTYSSVIKNNTAVPKRKPNDRLLIGLSDKDNKTTELWVSKKDGTELQKLTSVRFSST